MGFMLLFGFILLPLSIIFFISFLIKQDSKYIKYIFYVWASPFLLGILLMLANFLTSKKVLNKSDFYGTYVIDRDKYPGKQAEWQYKTFKLIVRKNDSAYFIIYDNDKIVQKIVGKFTPVYPYETARMKLDFSQPSHHIIASQPTVYRSAWSFYIVFQSKKFNNVFFKKETLF